MEAVLSLIVPPLPDLYLHPQGKKKSKWWWEGHLLFPLAVELEISLLLILVYIMPNPSKPYPALR